jgi:hypothetical protein
MRSNATCTGGGSRAHLTRACGGYITSTTIRPGCCLRSRSFANSPRRGREVWAGTPSNTRTRGGNEGAPISAVEVSLARKLRLQTAISNTRAGAVAGHTAGVTCVMLASSCIT